MIGFSPRPAFAALVFDFDGTLVDGSGIKKRAFLYALDAGITADSNKCELAYAKYGTINRIKQLALSFEFIYSRSPTETEQAALVDAYAAYVRTHRNECILFPGLPEFHTEFSGRYQFMISSNAPNTEINEHCDSLGIHTYFSRIYGYPVSKTDALREITQSLGVTSDNVLYVGDRVEDEMAAAVAGTAFCRLDPGFHEPSHKAGILRSLADLKAELNSLEMRIAGAN
jgi:phosphoglycolate phosphatase-like HAD superfamily hydrolase